MRRLAQTLLVSLLFFTLSCDKTKDEINDATEFDITYSSQFTMPDGSLEVTGPADFTSPEIPTESNSRFAAEKTAKDLIDEIKLIRFVFTTNTGNFDYLKNLTIFIQADGLPEKQVCSKNPVPNGVSLVTMDLGDVNIKEYISKDKIKFRVTVNIDDEPTGTQLLRFEQTVRVKGKKIN